jgi:hypothetical protein
MHNNPTEFKIRDIVYFKLDKDQNPMLIISIWIKEDGVLYECRNPFSNKEYYSEFEISKEENILTKIK